MDLDISPTSSGSSPVLKHDQSPAEQGSSEPKKKRKRLVNNEKKHVCTEPGCDKAFSRPDHLSRHRLNHNPLTTYHCSYTPCSKTFVRLDLLVRHEERHLRKVDPDKAAEHRARTAKAQARATQAGASGGGAVAAAAAAAAAAASDSEHGSPYTFSGAQLPPLAAPLQAEQLSNDQQHAFQQRMYPLPSAFSPAAFTSHGVGGAGGQPYNGFSPSTATHGELYGQQGHYAGPSHFRPDASTSGSAASAIPPNSTAPADIFLPHHHAQHSHSPHDDPLIGATTTSQAPAMPQQLGNPFGSFDPTPPPAMQISALDLVQASYGAPFVSASEYDWLFDPTGGFDISFPQSRPASPFGAGSGSAGSSAWNANGMGMDMMAGMGGMTFGAGGHGGGLGGFGAPGAGAGGAGGGFQSAMGMGSMGMGGMGLGEIGMGGGAGEGVQQQEQHHTPRSADHISPEVSQQLEEATRDLGFAQQQHHQQQHHQQLHQQAREQPHAPPSHSAFEWGTIVEESPSAAQTPAMIEDHPSHSPVIPSPQPPPPPPPPARRASKTSDSRPFAIVQPPTPAPAPAPVPVVVEPVPAPPELSVPASVTAGVGGKQQPSGGKKGKGKEGEAERGSSATTSDSTESTTQTAATSVRTPYDQTHDVSIFIDNETRMRVIDYCGPSWQNLRGDTRMTRGAMMEYLESFWTRVHETQAPAVHRASFKAATAPTPLLLSMMLLGCYFSSPEAYKLACNLHSGFRGKVLCSNDFRPRAELWLHQTILFIVIFGKLCSTRMDHEMSHIFWSSCVTLGRRSAIFSQRQPAVFAPGHDDVETQWQAWIEEEVAKRIALIVFGVDVEHAAFFRHSPTLSAFQIQLQLPCDEELWEARDAQEWARLRVDARPPIPFISALKASLMAGQAPPALNPFSRIAILHGLLSVAQDLQWRDHVIGMSQPEGRSNNWRDMISASYNSWKSRLDTCLVTATFPTSQLLRASISLYAVAHITLSIDIHELQIQAGAESALGLVVSAAIYNATEARLKIWSSTKDARAAVWHAAFFLRSSMQHYQQSTVDLAGCLHHRWSVFISTLVLYCYGRATSGPPDPGSRSQNYQESAMRYLDSMCTNSPEGLLTVANKNNTLDLCQTICEYVEASRWEIAQEGSRILRRLLTKNPGPPNA